jgi:hypothetical protein
LEDVPQSRSLLGGGKPEEEEMDWRPIAPLVWFSWVLGFPEGRRASRGGSWNGDPRCQLLDLFLGNP